MTKNCESKQQSLDRYLRNELNPVDRAALTAHLATCPDCREALEFRRSLDLRLAGAIEVPATLRAKFEAAVSPPAPSLLVRTLGARTMKRILISSTALAAIFGGAILLVPGRAHATTAKAKFVSMRDTMRKLVQQGALTVQATAQPGREIEFTITLDGQPLPPDVPVNIEKQVADKYTDYTVTIDLSDSAFTSISFGADQNTLELVPKKAPDHRDVVQLDPKSGRPVSWLTKVLRDDDWAVQSNISFIVPDHPVKVPPLKATSVVTHDATTPTKQSDGFITVLKMRITDDAGSATMSPAPTGNYKPK